MSLDDIREVTIKVIGDISTGNKVTVQNLSNSAVVREIQPNQAFKFNLYDDTNKLFDWS